MRAEQDLLWQQFLAVCAEFEQLNQSAETVSVDEWNEKADQVNAYQTKIQRDQDMMQNLFEHRDANNLQEPFVQRCLYRVGGEMWLSAVEDDQYRVLYASELNQDLRLFLAPWEGESDIYEQDTYDAEDELSRDLSRIGGTPTMLAGDNLADAQLIFQIDFGGLFHGGADEPYADFLDNRGLPKEGLLQFYQHDQQPLVVRYLSETQLQQRVPIVKPHEQRAYQMNTRVLPYVTTESSQKTLQEYAHFLREEAKRATFNGSYTRQMQTDMNQVPFTTTLPAVSQVIGRKISQSKLSEQLKQVLPIIEHDAYVHLAKLVDVRGEIIEVMIRESDLIHRRFEKAVMVDSEIA
jgi:hypothetical protein